MVSIFCCSQWFSIGFLVLKKLRDCRMVTFGFGALLAAGVCLAAISLQPVSLGGAAADHAATETGGLDWSKIETSTGRAGVPAFHWEVLRVAGVLAGSFW